mmetsp:Transcript_7239/g.24041  ORF Transcript_7239/g.24041 Transcript_7239/m.24041 type:complete len:224 (-) Transcript_7239:475-1146(-)
MTSSLRYECAEMEFSAMHKMAVSSTSSQPPARAPQKAPKTAAPPPMSVFIEHIPAVGLSERPPVSYTIDFPTSATFRDAFPPAGVCLSTTSAGSRPANAAERPTASSPPNPPALSASYRFTSAVTVSGKRAASASASAVSSSQFITFGGESTRRCARRMPSAAAEMRARRASGKGAGAPPSALTPIATVTGSAGLASSASSADLVLALYSGKHRAAAQPAAKA